jgi:uncharacterized membrane protein YdcZ (DUF606 family)
MLPLYGMAVVAAKQGDPAGFVAITIVMAQGVMIVASLVAMHVIQKEGAWIVMLVSFLALPHKYGWFGMEVHPLGGGRMLGAALMVGGIVLISRF